MHAKRKLHAFEARTIKNAATFRDAIERGDHKAAATLIAGSLGTLAIIAASDDAKSPFAASLIGSVQGKLEAVSAALSEGSSDLALHAYVFLLESMHTAHRLAGMHASDGDGGRGGDTPDFTDAVATATRALIG